MAAAFHPLKVADVEELTDDAVAVTFEVPDDLADEFAFMPGQSLTLRRIGRRCRAAPAVLHLRPGRSRPRVGVREIPDGLFSRWLVRDVRPGDEIEVQTPSGRFCPDPALLEGGRHLCIAAGSGHHSDAVGRVERARDGGEVTLLYGNRTTGSVMFAEELADLKNRYGPQLQLVHVLSREPRDVELFSGRLDADRLRRLLTTLVPGRRFDHVWLCGPHAMLLDAQAVLAELGVPARPRALRALLRRRAAARAAPRRGRGHRRDHRGDRRPRRAVARRPPLPREQTVLDGAQAMRSDLPFACKGGVCGTCRARVTDGEVDMRRNYALEPAEVEAGFVLTCQTYPVGDRGHRGLRRMSGPPDPLDTARRMWAEDPASRALGMELLDLGPGRAVVAMTVRADMVNGLRRRARRPGRRPGRQRLRPGLQLPRHRHGGGRVRGEPSSSRPTTATCWWPPPRSGPCAAAPASTT